MEVKRKVVLWTYKVLQNGEHEIRVRLTLYKEPKYIGIGFSSSVENWDEENECPHHSHPKYKAIIRKIEEIKEDIQFELKFMQKTGVEMISLTELIAKVKKTRQPLLTTKLFAFTDQVVADLEAADKIGYANIFKNCKAVLIYGFGPKDKSFVSFTQADFESFERYLLSNDLKDTSISNYLRTFYRIWNMAIKAGMCPKDHHPSKFIKFKAYKKYKTSKRAIKANQIKAIEDQEIDPTLRKYRSQQYFLFSYYSRGINFVDLAKLKHKNINNGEIHYRRTKNGRTYDFPLHSKAKAIIEIFKAYPLQSDGDYIFPILKAEHDTAKKIDARLDSALKDLNEDLKKMQEDAGIEKTITSYVARHSFATNLRHKKVDIGLIQEAMGHETESQTMIYLEEYDDSILAESIEAALG